MTSSTSTRPLSLLSLWLAAAWIATGALYKLLAGSPKDLPPVLLQSELPAAWVFNGAIGIELAVVGFALLKPRWGWVLVALQLAAFLAVLGYLMAQGAESCGCFGSDVTIPPLAMAAIDGALLAFLLFTRPWSGIRAKWLPLALPLATGALALALPWVMSRQVQQAPPLSLNGDGAGTAAIAVDMSGGDAAEAGSEPAAAEATAPAAPKNGSGGGSGWAEFRTNKWSGQLIFDTELASYLAPDQLPLDGLVSFYRQSCDHCRDHLLAMTGTETGLRPVTLIRVPDDEGATALVEVKPSGAHVTELTLTPGIEYVVETPLDLELLGGMITSVTLPAAE